MRQFPAAAAIFMSVTMHTAAQAQLSVDQAHATVNRLLNGAGDVVILKGGKTLDAYFALRNVRSSARCTTTYKATIPHHPEIPKAASGTSGDGEIQWSEIRDTRVAGRDYFRRDTAQGFTAHFRFQSSAAASQFAEAASIIMKTCGSGEQNEQDEQDEQDEQPAEEVVHNPRGNTASLAIDRRNGSRYGWAVDYESLSGSDARALAECKRGTSNCQVVLRFTGGCGAYAADQTKGSSVYGWGTAGSRNEAESRARAEARKRGGTSIVTRVWGCNSVKAAGAAKASGGASASSGTGSTGTGLSDEVVRRNAAAVKAHQSTVDKYQNQLKANEQKIGNAIAERRAVQEAHERELAKARAAREQYERERQAYRDEYKRITGRYPDE